MKRRKPRFPRFRLFLAAVWRFLVRTAVTAWIKAKIFVYRNARISLADIRFVGEERFLSTPEEVRLLEQELATTFPAGYEEYVTTLGEGVMGGCYIRIYPPHRVKTELAEWRKRIDQYWFWDEGPCPKKLVLECIVFGDTLDGDELIFHPREPHRIYVLPRYFRKSMEIGADLWQAIEWLCSAGVLTEPFGERRFEPFTTRGHPSSIGP